MLTDLEKLVLRTIPESEHAPGNGFPAEELDDCSTWVFSAIAASELNEKSWGGVASNLQKKDLIWIQDNGSEDENEVGLTEDGFKMYKTMKEEGFSSSIETHLKEAGLI